MLMVSCPSNSAFCLFPTELLADSSNCSIDGDRYALIRVLPAQACQGKQLNNENADDGDKAEVRKRVARSIARESDKRDDGEARR